MVFVMVGVVVFSGLKYCFELLLLIVFCSVSVYLMLVVVVEKI